MSTFYCACHVDKWAECVDQYGHGVRARRALKQGELLADPTAVFHHGPVPPNMRKDQYLKYSDGYFLMRSQHPYACAISYYLNEARPSEDPKQQVNLRWKVDTRHDRQLHQHRVLQWEVVSHINEGKELLIEYIKLMALEVRGARAPNGKGRGRGSDNSSGSKSDSSSSSSSSGTSLSDPAPSESD